LEQQWVVGTATLGQSHLGKDCGCRAPTYAMPYFCQKNLIAPLCFKKEK